MSLEILAPAALAVATAGANLTRTTVEDHRVWTHRSVAFRSDRAEKVYRVAGSHLTDTKRWAAVHRVHHSTPDANLVPFLEFADYYDWNDAQTTLSEGQAEIPDEIHGLDPVLTTLDASFAYEIGSLARELVRGKYTPALGYSPTDATRILHGTTPRYFYESQTEMKHDRKNPVKFDPANPPPLHDMRFLLRDPHSPPLHHEGILGILKYNVPLYGYAEQNFADPRLRPDDLQPDQTDIWVRDNRTKLRYGYVGAMVAANILLSRPKSKERLAAAAVLGAAASGLAVVGLITGGNVTNALGHAGDVSRLTFREALDGKVYPKLDGTYTSNKKALSPITLDEVGGQETHHDHPELIAYSIHEGARQVRDAQFGSFVKFLVDHGIVLKEGDNFEGMDQRPDLPSEAVLRIQELRAKQLANAA